MSPAQPDPQPRAPRLLIVRPSALGDVARTVPALVTLRRAHPHAHIDWLVAEAFADAVRHHPMLDGVVTFARDRLARFGLKPSATREGLALRRRLREGRYDIVYDLQGLFRSGLFTFLTAAPRRVGFAEARELGWLGCNVRHPVAHHPHTVDRMLALLQAEGMTPVRDMRLYLADEDQRWLDRYLAERNIREADTRPGSPAAAAVTPPPADYACLAPTARWPSKCWPIDRYAHIARRLLDTGAAGSHLVVLASPTERDQVTPLLDALPQPLRQRVHLPRTTVGQMMAILSRTRLLVCNDSAPLHIAVGFDRPIVAIFGPTDPAHVGPYRRPDTVLRPPTADTAGLHYRRHLHDTSLIAQVTVDEVWQKITDQLTRAEAA